MIQGESTVIHQKPPRNSQSNRSSKLYTQISQKITTFYEFYINDPEKNKKNYKHKSNHISTTKYNVFTFLPKSFLLQFSRPPNIYFLFIAIIQSIPIISPLTSVTAILPLIFVLCVSMLRELVEDIQRYKYDKLSNSHKVKKINKGKELTIKSEHIEVGDVIIVNENEEFPCDMILLDSMNKESIAYIETASLDGEKTLKTKLGIKELKGLFYENGEKLHFYKSIKGKCLCDMPNPELYRFDGKININLDNGNNGRDVPVTCSQLLLKGALLRQTKQIVGICVYTGHNNKILLNSKNPKMKLSRLEHCMSKLLIVIFIIQIILCIVCAVMHRKYEETHSDFYANYIFQGSELGKVKNESFISFFTYLLLLNTMIPISLIVTLEIVKVIQGFFISQDVELYSHLRKKFCNANSVSIIEELGKINYIFSDKTGTLTCNKMQFKFCIIGNVCYEYEDDSQYLNSNNVSHKKSNTNINEEENPHTSKAENIVIYKRGEGTEKHGKGASNNNVYLGLNSNGNVTDKSRISLLPTKNDRLKVNLPPPLKISNNYMANYISNKQNSKLPQFSLIKEFWYALSIGNECVPIEGKNGSINYSGLSPDDIELVSAAAKQGFALQKSPNDFKIISLGSSSGHRIIEKYKVLNMISFTSDRKRMSIIVKTENDEIKLYIKGADSEIKKRLSSDTNRKHLASITKCTDYFSSKGYRTLFVGYKIIPLAIYMEWSEKLRNSELDLENKAKLVPQCQNEIEQDITLLGATIVEDKLQDKVPDTIRDLRQAGIKIWMLTGDKIDTAENISLSCNLISRSHQCFKISPMTRKRQKTLTSELKTNIPELSLFLKEYTLFEEKTSHLAPFSLLIESAILSKIFSDEETCDTFLSIAVKAESVVCCRVSPLQKALVVKHVKEKDKKNITLSIGDGGNDVSMILEAHVGVGIHGEEGVLAVQSSDFAIGEFKYLRRLLFFHGRTSLNRTSHMILYFFYKNFVFTILQFYFCYYNIASGQSLIDDWFITLFNLLFTALPLGVQALSNFDVREEDNENVRILMPLMYKESKIKSVFNVFSFTMTILKAVLFSVINYFTVMKSGDKSAIGSNGRISDIWFNSLNLYTNIIYTVSLTLLISQHYIIALVPIFVFLTTFGLYYAFCFYAENSIYFNSHAIIIASFSSWKFYLNLIFVSALCFIVDFLLHCSSILMSDSISSELMRERTGYKSKIIARTIKALTQQEVCEEQNEKMDEKSYDDQNDSYSKEKENFSLKILNINSGNQTDHSQPKRSHTTQLAKYKDIGSPNKKHYEDYIKRKTFDIANGGNFDNENGNNNNKNEQTGNFENKMNSALNII